MSGGADGGDHIALEGDVFLGQARAGAQHQRKPGPRGAALRGLRGRWRRQGRPPNPPGESNSALLFLEREKNRMPPGEVDELDVGDDSLDEERKIPLKLMRRGERGGDSW